MVNTNTTCCICLGVIRRFDNVVQLTKCGHRFHARCHAELVNHAAAVQKGVVQNPTSTTASSHTCPMCREPYENSAQDVCLHVGMPAVPRFVLSTLRRARWKARYRAHWRRMRDCMPDASTRRRIHEVSYRILRDFAVILGAFIVMRILFPCRRTTNINWLVFQFTCDEGVVLIVIGVFYFMRTILQCCQ